MNEEEKKKGDNKANQYGMFIHFSLLGGIITPVIGLVLPIILWQLKKDQYPIVNEHGKIVVNWIISCACYFLMYFLFLFSFVGITGFILLGLLFITFPIVGGIKANNGEVWKYPLSFNVL